MQPAEMTLTTYFGNPTRRLCTSDIIDDSDSTSYFLSALIEPCTTIGEDAKATPGTLK